MRRRSIYLLMSLVVTLWGGAFVAIKILLRHSSVWGIALFRFLLTTAGLWIVMAVVRPPARSVRREHLPKIVLMGLTGVAAYHLSLNFGERAISANVAPLIIASMPVMVAILARLVLDEDVGAAKWAGIAMAIVGVVVLMLWGTPGATLSVKHVGGAAVTAIAPAAWAIYTVTSKQLVATYGALRLSTWAITLGTALLVPFAIVPAAHDLGHLTTTDWLWLAFLGFGCTTFAYTVWFHALEVLDASRVAAWVYLVPGIALLWGSVVLGESITIFVLLGGAMVLGGVILVERVAPARARRAAGTEEGIPV